nr:hypothetical protein [uncultured Romboutsia sp.]
MGNRINLLVVEIDLLDIIEKYYINSLINLNFESIDIKCIALENLQKFGVVKSINEAIGEELYIKYFDNCSLEERLYSEYCINKILFLDSSLSKNIKSNISDSIKSLLGDENIISIKEIQKMEYRLYGY